MTSLLISQSPCNEPGADLAFTNSLEPDLAPYTNNRNLKNQGLCLIDCLVVGVVLVVAWRR